MKKLKVMAIICPICKDTIYSRARHDFRTCSCENCYIDGGFDYTRIGGNSIANIEVIEIEVEASKEKLLEDWRLGKDKYGLIKGEEENE